ncbi:TPA: sulfurtransferase [Corynebacterium striatum]|nr:sulfurtransferase [Corynebacterium striatum]HAT1168174.1 sulfurtransferase [Corynebacterium striatum]HAT1173191.1 sulfurtransferase [Corynebacterium striatum]HAT1198464.1 sulfurtransferase [Corynebacterium striatum]HAT1201414.1 sulfurtransferase [Corynebacterium striatum]
MAEFDPNPPFQEYAHPERLVSAPWLSARLGIKGLRVIEVDEDSLLYDIGHVPTASRINFQTELLDPVTRDIVSAEGFAQLMRDKGIKRDDTVVIYGDKANWWAAYALWVFELYGHPDVRLLDGGRDAWVTEERDTSFMVPDFPESDYPEVERNDETYRIFVDQVRGTTVKLVDTRTPEEFFGEATHESPNGDSAYGTTMRHGHIPGAVNLEWDRAVYPNGCFRALSELNVNYGELEPASETVLYSHVGAQAAHTWFVLTFLLGFKDAKVYDGSWAEWGNMIRMPIEG